MSFYHNLSIVSRRFRLVSSSFLQADGLQFTAVLPESRIKEAFDAEGLDFAQGDDEFYTPTVTLWASLSQTLHSQEMWTCLLAYNLIRKALLEAAYETDRSPRELSFTTAMQTIAASLGTLAGVDEELAARLIAAQIASLTEQIVGDRPNRVEPRAVKRRWKPIALLTKPRAEARAELLHSASRS